MEEQTIKFLNKLYVLAIVLVAGVVLFLLASIGYQNRYLDIQNQNQITVSGEGKVYAKPDIATINLGVTAQAVTVADATKSGTDKMNAVIASVKKLGVEDKDIQTTNYSLNPVYENYSTPVPMMYPATGMGGGGVSSSAPSYIRSGTKITGYRLDQNVEVKIRDFTKIGDILSAGTSSGANVAGSLQFSIDNPQQFRDEARAKAIAQAKENAQNLAKTSGIGLGKLINVIEGNQAPYAVMYDSLKATGMGGADSVSVPTIQPGQQEIDVTISLTYQVK